MGTKSSIIPLITFFNTFSAVLAGDYYVMLTSNSPVVRGATVHFVARLYEEGGSVASGSFRYDWRDNALHSHTRSFESKSAVDTWNVSYSSKYAPGPYEVEVVVYKSILMFYYPITSQRLTFNLTINLNGKIGIVQKQKSITGKFVSNAEPVRHLISLKEADADFLNNSATSIVTYWFIDCVYYGPTLGYDLTHNYTEAEEEHTVEALVVAGFEPITTPAPSTTVAPTITTSKPSNGTKTTATTAERHSTSVKTIKPKSVANTSVNNTAKVKRSVENELQSNSTGIMVKVNGTLIAYNVSFPYVCLNNSIVAPDAKKTYGYFSRKFAVKAPVSNISVTGNNWLQHGDILSLKVMCHGSKMFNYCVHFERGLYNVTGNETCIDPDTSDKCEFPIKRYFTESIEHTIVVVIYNEVGKIVSPVTVNVYKVQKQAQLSVIVVPVAFSLVAVVLIVFGVAYYMQNRRSFIVEVADFNFGQQYSDLEYKTFKERLYDSMSNAFIRAPSPASSEAPHWPPGRKYGSMT